MQLKQFVVTCGLAVFLAGAIAQAQSGNTISVPVSGLHNNNGNVRCGL